MVPPHPIVDDVRIDGSDGDAGSHKPIVALLLVHMVNHGLSGRGKGGGKGGRAAPRGAPRQLLGTSRVEALRQQELFNEETFPAVNTSRGFRLYCGMNSLTCR